MKQSQFIFSANKYPIENGIRVLEASAGTGKTFSLGHIILRLLTEKEYSIKEILVVSFTKATAAEIKAKINKRIISALKALEISSETTDSIDIDHVMKEWIDNHIKNNSLRLHWMSLLLKALEDIDHADITTIHGFCRRTLKREALETSSAIEPQQLQEEDNKSLILDIVHEYWRDQILNLKPFDLIGIQDAGISIKSLGKALTQLEQDPCLKFILNDKSINTTDPLNKQLSQWIETFWSNFSSFWEEEGYELEESIRKTIKDLKNEGVEDTKPYSASPRKNRYIDLNEWVQEINSHSANERVSYGEIRDQKLLKSHFHPQNLCEIERRNELDISLMIKPGIQEAIAKVWDGPAENLWFHALAWTSIKLKERKFKNNFISYGDQLKALDPGLENSRGTSSELTKKLRKRYRVALVDEFQDTDPIQWRILNQTFGKSNEHLLLMVGDPKQAIYKFRGGDLHTYLHAKESADRIDALLTNFRTAPLLMQSINKLFEKGLVASQLEVPPLDFGSKEKTFSSPSCECPLEILTLNQAEILSTTPQKDLPSKSKVEEDISIGVSNYILQLLQKHSKELTPEDICILVSRHKQAEIIQTDLIKAGLPSRLASQGDVLTSEAAKSLQVFLDCIADPADTGNINLLASSPLMQWSVAKLKTAESNGEINAVVIKLRSWSKNLSKIGIIGCISELLEGYNLADLSLRGRFLCDLQQCTEIAQEVLHMQGLNARGIARWFRQQRLLKSEPVPNNRRPNSDINETAINITTIHQSKGLQYKVVICPYLWESPPLSEGPLWRSEDDREWIISINNKWGERRKVLNKAKKDSIQEAERLAYVALTRAQKHLAIVWARAKNQEGNPLTSFLFGPEALNLKTSQLTNERMLEWINNQENTCVISISPNKINDYWHQQEETSFLSLGPSPSRLLDKSWGRYSYSSWIAGSYNQKQQATSQKVIEEGRDIDQQRIRSKRNIFDYDLVQNNPASLSLDIWDTNNPLSIFPRGPLAGDCLHKILEKIDFQKPTNNVESALIIKEELRRSGIEEKMEELVQKALTRVLEIPLEGVLGNLRLKQLNSRRKITELNFDLSLSKEGSPITALDIANAIRKNPKSRFGSSYADKLEKLNIYSKGILTGSIDLVFTDKEDSSKARWWVTDWKSNWLGNQSNKTGIAECGPANYLQKAMEKEMVLHHYPLQGLLYLVALHRFLKWRLDNYSPELHLGGYIYVFIRGIPQKKELKEITSATKIPGLIIEDVPLETVLELDKLILEGKR